MSEDKTKKAREPKKNSIPNDRVNELVKGIPQYEKTSFLVVGHKDGVRIAIPKTSGVSRAYFYGNGDYSIIPSHAAITVFTEEQRKEGRKGGIMAEIDFEKGLEQAEEALAKLIDVVRSAKKPETKPAKIKAAPKAKAADAPSNPEEIDPPSGEVSDDEAADVQPSAD